MQTGFPADTEIKKVKKIQPIEYMVLIKPDHVDERTGGGLYLPDTARDKQQHAVDRGIIVSMAGNAFTDDAVWSEKPKIGDWVIFDKYAGSLIEIGESREKEKFRLITDKSVKAILEAD